VLQSSEAKAFLQQWLRARQALEATAQSDLAVGGAFSEAATQSAFVSLANHQCQSDSTINTVLSHCNQLLRRTEPLSPSKHPAGMSPSLQVAQDGHYNHSPCLPLTGLPAAAPDAAQRDAFGVKFTQTTTGHPGEMLPLPEHPASPCRGPSLSHVPQPRVEDAGSEATAPHQT
jgi:hypothetical protein